MTDDEAKIRALIERWAAAVHAGDPERVLANHSEDIVMFDVPPPYEGVRGIDAYRKTLLRCGDAAGARQAAREPVTAHAGTSQGGR